MINYSTLIALLINNIEETVPYCGEITIDNTSCMIDGAMPNSSYHKTILPYYQYKFVIQNNNNGSISIFIYRIDDNRYDQTVCATIPDKYENGIISYLHKEG